LGYGINKTINVVPTGIELSSFDKENVSTRDINEFISRYGLENKFRICFLGRLAKEKNVECLIKGFKEVVAFNKNVVFIIAGYGPWEEELKECALQNGVLEYTIFTGSQPHSAVPVVYRSSNVFCSASKTETQGITYIEAMASERPVVAIYDESLEGLLEDGKNGFFFNDENDFAQKIIHLMKMDKENFAEICKNAKEKSKEFSIEKFGESIENVYENAILKLLN
jgi:1,2-diacylglycerol 3-alpha-glucosyltransferase